MQHARRFLYQSGGVRLAPQTRSERHLSGSECEETSRGIAAGESARQLAKRLGRSPSTVSREIARNGGRDRYRAARPMRPPTSEGTAPSRPSSPSGPLCAPWWKPYWPCVGHPSRSPDGCDGSFLVTPPCRSRTKRSTSRSTALADVRRSTAASPSGCGQAGPCATLRSPAGPPDGASSAAWCPSPPALPRSRTARSPATGRATS
ncbi:helix-turn-helix domain-containing protein [Streptomyces exfoliatus]|uniref:helix-turn-helix domain-containing protein n=1 Tax=Streptomyces exfoliatus TaxID=1905 RepID=UPI00324BFF8D